ncbi:hypothetical protein GCM10009006_18170 [Haloarcula argentinensis]|uniref:Uncharacterized protein n=1 Tax=Haloarcula argentinensis TaxID=43776 RepID=A0A830FTV2_HALAR|nr:hypothetical protein GCM10009006_18170 [Haloarcula argentinensis]
MVDIGPERLKFAMLNFYQDMDAYDSPPPKPCVQVAPTVAVRSCRPGTTAGLEIWFEFGATVRADK